MLTSDDFSKLPNDKYLAYAKLEEMLKKGIENLDHDPQIFRFVNSYAKILNEFSLRHDLEIPEIPRIPEYQMSSGNVDQFISDVLDVGFERRVLALVLAADVPDQIEGEIGVDYINIDEQYKYDILSYCEKIRKVIYAAEINPIKEGKILNSLNKFINNVNDNRIMTERFGQVFIDISASIGEGAEKLEPAVKILERIAKLFKIEQDKLLGNEELPKLEGPADED